MIVGERSTIVRLDDFLKGLLGARKGVARVILDGNAVSTGIAITPSLVLVPSFVFGSGTLRADQIQVSFEDGERRSTIWARDEPERIGASGGGPDTGPDGIALIDLERPRPHSQLQFSFEQCRAGQAVWMMHHPAGQPDQCVSAGQLTGIETISVLYDADTEPGSSGAPVFDENWRVVAMHVASDTERNANRGLAAAHLISLLRASKHWDKIVRIQGIADVERGRQKLKEETPARATTYADALYRAAVTASVIPKQLPKPDAEALKPYVVDASATRWALRPEVRMNVIRSAGSLDALRKWRPKGKPRNESNVLQRVMNRILDTSSLDLERLSDDELSWGIQASRWFANVAPDLPKPAEISRELERRRIRGQLEAIAGNFQGRKKELKDLRDWYREDQPPPLCITGIGGVGKSALVARFATTLPEETLLIWLDFDRPDLAADDGASVLEAIVQQVKLQIPSFTAPEMPGPEWKAEASALGRAITPLIASAPHPLMILDSFEVAQYAERYTDLWPVLQGLAAEIPKLRLIVTGRAPIEKLTVRGQPIRAMRIGGLKRSDARVWLHAGKVTQPKVVDSVLDMSRGVPLILLLAMRYVTNGGKVRQLPKNLPDEIKAGFLYDRILDRVQNPQLKDFARAALVVRRLTSEMIVPVFEGVVTLPKGTPESIFALLQREMALAEGGEVLRLRPEVRSATLRILIRQFPAMVKELDQRAAKWFASQNVNDPEIAAELVYHRLRLGDIAGAEGAWRDGCGANLQYAADDLEPAPKKWLQDRIGETSLAEASVGVWEQNAAERIRGLRGRSLGGGVASKIGMERTDRSDHSPLVFHEAFERYFSGDSPGAREQLAQAGPAPGPIGRDRTVLSALLAAQAGEREKADALLAPLEDLSVWSDRPQGAREALAITAARIRFATEIQAEIDLQRMVARSASADIAAVDVVLPRFGEHIAARLVLERAVVLRIPTGESPAEIARFNDQLAPMRETWGPMLKGDLPPSTNEIDRLVERVRAAGRQRWSLAVQRGFLNHACEWAKSGPATGDPLAMSVFGSLALYAGQFGGVRMDWNDVPLFAVLQSSAGRGLISTEDDSDSLENRTILLEGVLANSFLIDQLFTSARPGTVDLRFLFFQWDASDRAKAITYHLLTREPLTPLAMRLAGITGAKS